MESHAKRWLVAFATSALAGCSLLVSLDQLGGDAGTSDAAPDVQPDAPADAADAAVGCDLTKPFATPIRDTRLSTAANDCCARLTQDETTAYLASALTGSGPFVYDLYVATRDAASQP